MHTIRFILDANYPFDIPAPIPASDYIPDWYRSGESFINKNTGLLEVTSNEDRAAGMKSCMPFLDTLSSGYYLTTWADIEVTKNEGGVIEFQYIKRNEKGWTKDPTAWEMLNERHGDIGHTMPRPAGHSQNHMVWSSKWGFSVPKGWTVLVTHPLNQFQLPFTSSSGIIDSDRFGSHGNMPFFFKEGWTGIIEKGTPYAQLIPIKRSDWVSVAGRQTDKELFIARQARNVQYGYYRSKLWVPKKYRKGE